LKPGQRVWDDELSGFCVRCQVGTKVYGVQYRHAGIQRWITIGKASIVPLPDAREMARDILIDAKRGLDPAAERDRRKALPTLAMFGDTFLKEHVDVKLKDRTAAEYRRLIEDRINPVLGKLRIDAVSEADVDRLHQLLKATPYEANRALAVLSAVMSYAESPKKHRPKHSNPCVAVVRYEEHKRERLLTAEELGRLGDALAAAEAEGKVSLFVIAALRLLIFTGCRRSEVLGMRWRDIDTSRKQFKVPDPKEKGGAKWINLSDPALQVLAKLPRIHGNPYVFAGGRSDHDNKGDADGEPLVDLFKPWAAIRKTAELDDVRIHDLRHCYASVAAGHGASLPVIGRLLGHRNPQTTARYAHLATDPIKALNDKIGETLATALG
jgi:integrase